MTVAPETPRPLVLLGAGGHALVLFALAVAAGHRLKGVCDPRLVAAGTRRWQGLPVLGDDTAIDAESPSAVGLINGIGHLPGGTARKQLFERMRARGFQFPALVHPAAWVAPGVALDEGVQIMAGAVIQAGLLILGGFVADRFRSERLMRHRFAMLLRSIRPQPIITSEAAIADFGR